jgi:ankyrin repeat protein
MKHLLLTTIAAVVLVGCGATGAFAQETPEGTIFEAIWNDDANAVKEWIDWGYDVNFSSEGESFLHLAASSGCENVVVLLINEGANVNAKTDTGYTPLDYALLGTETEAKQDTAEFLRSNGAKSGAGDSVHVAAALGNLEAIQTHLDSGMDINAKDRGYGETPLFFAAQKNQLLAVKRLIEHGANPDGEFPVSGSTSPIFIAASLGHLEVVNYLLEKNPDLFITGDFGNTLLHAAAGSGLTHLSKVLIHAGHIVDISNNRNSTPLMMTAGNEKVDLAKTLVAYSSNIEKQNSSGNTALHWAAEAGDAALCELLLGNGANTNPRNNLGETPLHLAVKNNHYTVYSSLSSHGNNLDLNAKTTEGNTPLHYCAIYDEATILTSIEHLAFLSLNIHGKSPMTLAKELGFNHIASLLGDFDYSKPSIWEAAYTNDLTEIIFHINEDHSLELNYGSGVSWWEPEKPYNGMTPLAIAADKGLLLMVNLLLENGANPNTIIHKPGFYKLSRAIDFAVKNNNTVIVRKLIESGAELDGRTSLLKLAIDNSHFDLAVELFEEANSKGINLLNTSLINLLIKRDSYDVLKYFIETTGGVKKFEKESMNYGPPDYLCNALSKDFELFFYFYSQGADMSLQRYNGGTIMHYAAATGSEDIGSLLDLGANINSIDIQGHTPLDLAKNNITASTLIQYGAKLGIGKTVIDAVYNGDLDKVMNYIDSGGNANFHGVLMTNEGNYFMSTLLAAVHKGHTKIIEAILKAWVEDNLVLPIWLARNIEEVNLFLDYGANISSVDDFGLNVLHSIARTGDLKLLEYLISLGVDINSRTKYGYTPLHYATDSRVIELFLLKNAQLNPIDLFGKTPMDYATGDLLKAYEKFNAMTGIVESVWETALHGNIKNMNMFLAEGYNIHIVYDPFYLPLENLSKVEVEYMTPLQISIESHHWKLSKSIINHTELLDDLVNYDFNYGGGRGMLPLYQAAGSSAEIVNILLNRGANLNYSYKYELDNDFQSSHAPIDAVLKTEIADLMMNWIKIEAIGLLNDVQYYRINRLKNGDYGSVNVNYNKYQVQSSNDLKIWKDRNQFKGSDDNIEWGVISKPEAEMEYYRVKRE